MRMQCLPAVKRALSHVNILDKGYESAETPPLTNHPPPPELGLMNGKTFKCTSIISVV